MPNSEGREIMEVLMRQKEETNDSTDMRAARKRVLCVDDEPVNLMLLKGMLAGSNIDIVTAADGDAALEMIDKEAMALIFMDVLMPGLSGFDVCKKLKASEQYKHIPVIMITALSPSEGERMSREAGADAWLEKPINKKNMLEKLETYLN